MKLIKVLDKVNNDFKGVYECETCHGIRIDNGFDSYDDKNYYENVIPKMTCPLCDMEADLSKRYMMALDTLAAATGKTGKYKTGSDYGFPSVDAIYVDSNNVKYVDVFFNINGVRCEACSDYIRANDSSQVMGFDVRAALGELNRKLTAHGIAKELVSRVVEDLAAQHKG